MSSSWREAGFPRLLRIWRIFGSGRSPFPRFSALKTKNQRVKSKKTGFEASPATGHPEFALILPKPARSQFPKLLLQGKEKTTDPSLQPTKAKAQRQPHSLPSLPAATPSAILPARHLPGKAPCAERPPNFGDNRHSCSEFCGTAQKHGSNGGNLCRTTGAWEHQHARDTQKQELQATDGRSVGDPMGNVPAAPRQPAPGWIPNLGNAGGTCHSDGKLRREEGARRRRKKQRTHKPHRRLRGYQGGQHAAAGRAGSAEGDSDVIPGERQTVRGLLNHLRHLRRFVLQDREAFQLPVLTVGQLGEEKDAKRRVRATGKEGASSSEILTRRYEAVGRPGVLLAWGRRPPP